MFTDAMLCVSLVRSELFYFRYPNNAVSIHADTVIPSGLMSCLSDHPQQTTIPQLNPPPSPVSTLPPHFSTHPFPRDLSHYCHSHCSSLGHSPVCQSWWHRASPPSLCVVTATCLRRHCRWCQDAPSRRSPSSISLFLCPLHRLHGMLFCSVRQKSFDRIPGNVKALLENTQLSVRWLMQKASDHTQSNSW